MCGIKYQPQYLLRNYVLNIYLSIDQLEHFSLTDDKLYEQFYSLCNDVELLPSKYYYFPKACQCLQEQASDKVGLNLKHLNNLIYALDHTEMPESVLDYKAKFLALLSNGKASGNIKLCFSFKLNLDSKFLKAFDCIKQFFENTFYDKDKVIDVDRFLQYIQSTFTDDIQKTDAIVAACNTFRLNHANVNSYSILFNQACGDVFFDFNITNKNELQITSDRQVIPFDLIHFEFLKNNAQY